MIKKCHNCQCFIFKPGLNNEIETTHPLQTPGTGGGARFNDGKIQLSLILEAQQGLMEAARVLEFGAKKYTRGNWHRGLSHTQICDSLLRHLTSYLSGEDFDGESNCRHVGHILVNALFLAEMVNTRPDLDDRSEELLK